MGRRKARTYIGFVGAGFKDEFLRLMVPILDWGVWCCQTRRPQGQTGLSMPFFIPFLERRRIIIRQASIITSSHTGEHNALLK